jgi:hypothetical protein
VHAAGPGVVAFAGSVAGSLHVVIAHAGNLRTSYSFLATIAVRRGEPVEGGAVVGAAGGVGEGHDGSVVHFALRSGDDYVDPMLLFQPVDLATVVHLAPTRSFAYPRSRSNERRGLLAGLVHGAGAVLHAAGTALAAAGRGVGGYLAARFPLQAAVGRGLAAWLAQRRHCDSHAPGADGTGGSGHRVMVVAGVNSSITDGGPSSDLPTGALGYEAGEVSYFSYAPDGGDYTPADTQVPLLTSARRLGTQLRALERAEPGREVDLLAHSQGGVVVEAFLAEVYRPDDPSYPPLGTAVVMSSPLGGDTAATSAAGIRRTSAGRAALALADGALSRLGSPFPESSAASVRDLDKNSAFMTALRSADLPSVVQLTAIGAANDLVVPATDASRPGAQNATVTPRTLNAHGAIVTDALALRDTRAALEDRPLPCRSLAAIMTGEIVSTAVSTGEHAVGTLGALAVGAGMRP